MMVQVLDSQETRFADGDQHQVSQSNVPTGAQVSQHPIPHTLPLTLIPITSVAEIGEARDDFYASLPTIALPRDRGQAAKAVLNLSRPGSASGGQQAQTQRVLANQDHNWQILAAPVDSPADDGSQASVLSIDATVRVYPLIALSTIDLFTVNWMVKPGTPRTARWDHYSPKQRQIKDLTPLIRQQSDVALNRNTAVRAYHFHNQNVPQLLANSSFTAAMTGAIAYEKLLQQRLKSRPEIASPTEIATRAKGTAQANVATRPEIAVRHQIAVQHQIAAEPKILPQHEVATLTDGAYTATLDQQAQTLRVDAENRGHLLTVDWKQQTLFLVQELNASDINRFDTLRDQHNQNQAEVKMPNYYEFTMHNAAANNKVYTQASNVAVGALKVVQANWHRMKWDRINLALGNGYTVHYNNDIKTLSVESRADGRGEILSLETTTGAMRANNLGPRDAQAFQTEAALAQPQLRQPLQRSRQASRDQLALA